MKQKVKSILEKLSQTTRIYLYDLCSRETSQKRVIYLYDEREGRV